VLATVVLLGAPAAADAATPGGGGAAPAPSAPASAQAGTSPTRATDVASVARSLDGDPLYVSTAPNTIPVAGGDVRGALPPDVYVAVLPASAAEQTAGEAAALPGALLGQLPRPGTVLVLVGADARTGELFGASRTQRPDRLQEVLDDARARLRAGESPASTLVLAARGLTGSGQLSDPPSAERAGSPAGGLLWVLLAGVVAAILSVPILLRRARRPAVAPPPRVLRTRVEVDSYGHIKRRLTAQELADEQERAEQRKGRSGGSA
jgi:hypothetical protein